MSDVVIKVENLGKKYTIGHQAENGRYVALRDVLVHNAKSLLNKTKDLISGKPIIQGDTIEEVWALKDVSFEVQKGEVIGIIGRNGAGKSTLLKVLSRITEPSTGRVTIRGRVASLLEVGTGFHPELTGRENIYLNGTILGMARAEIKKKFDEIVEFAEIDKYLDTPVKRYSSGMYVRLAFAVAAHLEPEILVVDEVLAVGDLKFQQKCLGKMGEVSKSGRTVLFVSHNMEAIRTLCGQALYLSEGLIKHAGNVHHVVDNYISDAQAVSVSISDNHELSIGSTLKLRCFDFQPVMIKSMQDINYQIDIDAIKHTWIKEIALLIYSLSGIRVAIVDLRNTQGEYRISKGECLRFEGNIKCLPLVEGEYWFGLYIDTIDYSGNIFEITKIIVKNNEILSNIVPYSAKNRGLLEINHSMKYTIGSK